MKHTAKDCPFNDGVSDRIYDCPQYPNHLPPFPQQETNVPTFCERCEDAVATVTDNHDGWIPPSHYCRPCFESMEPDTDREPAEPSGRYERDMIDAGRGHLL